MRVFGLLTVLLLTGCVARPEPEPAVLRETAAPWDAPRDAISYIQAAGQPELGLGDDSDQWVLRVEVNVDGEPVEVPAYIGVDRLRAVQAPVHTHESGGDVWLEGQGNRESTLGDFFDLWGVRFDGDCLGATCGELLVEADGEVVPAPRELVLRGHDVVTVAVSGN